MGWTSTPKPDPNIGKAAMANASIAERQQTLAENELERQNKLYDEFAPTLRSLLDKQLQAQDKSITQSDQAWSDYNAIWRPAEQKLAEKSLGYDTPGRQEQAAQEAGAQVAQDFTTQRGATREALIRSGQDPSTIAALDAAAGLEEAKVSAGAKTGARRDIESKGLAYLDNAARFGRNMPSTGIATAQLAGQQGGMAQQQYGGLSDASSTAARTAGSLYQGAVNANSAAGGLLLGDYQARSNAANQSMGVFGDVLGAGLGAAGMYFSSKDSKKVGKKVEGAADAVAESPSYKWSYKPGLGDGDTKPREGPMADDLAKVAPEVSDGKMVDMIAMNGLHHAAIGEVTTRLERVEKKLGLSDAKKGA